MIEIVIEIGSMIMIGLGVIFFGGAALGIIRFPDFYTRVHATGKGDTLSSILIAGGLALYHLNDLSLAGALVSIKILMICGFVFITGPTTTHVLMEAGYEAGVAHWKKEDAENGEAQ